MGEVSVRSLGSCRAPRWRVEWLTNPGDQPLIQVTLFFGHFGGSSSTVATAAVLVLVVGQYLLVPNVFRSKETAVRSPERGIYSHCRWSARRSWAKTQLFMRRRRRREACWREAWQEITSVSGKTNHRYSRDSRSLRHIWFWVSVPSVCPMCVLVTVGSVCCVSP